MNYITKDTYETWLDNIVYIIDHSIRERKDSDYIAGAILGYLNGEGAFTLDDVPEGVKNLIPPYAEETKRFKAGQTFTLPDGIGQKTYTIREIAYGQLYFDVTNEKGAYLYGVVPCIHMDVIRNAEYVTLPNKKEVKIYATD